MEYDELTGIISYKLFSTTLDIHRVAVHPHYFRRGIAGTLINFIEGLGRIDKGTYITVFHKLI